MSATTQLMSMDVITIRLDSMFTVATQRLKQLLAERRHCLGPAGAFFSFENINEQHGGWLH